MINKLYVIYDRVAEEAGPIFQAVNDNVAARSASIALRDVQNIDDYDLLQIGEIDSETMTGFIVEGRKVTFTIRKSTDNKLAVVEVNE